MEHRKAKRRALLCQRNVAAISGAGTFCGWLWCVDEELNVLNIGMRVRGGCESTRVII
jgi:hypothetical protein